mmetsp:Transcript_29082/g.86109  ORF Transcript_29082/g.86109 Transcript_29082/m.86109 type:complete len:251 (+) Transcript_29082:789-1541(+)
MLRSITVPAGCKSVRRCSLCSSASCNVLSTSSKRQRLAGAQPASSCIADHAERRSGLRPASKQTLHRSMGMPSGRLRCASAASRVLSTPPLKRIITRGSASRPEPPGAEPSQQAHRTSTADCSACSSASTAPSGSRTACVDRVLCAPPSSKELPGWGNACQCCPAPTRPSTPSRAPSASLGAREAAGQLRASGRTYRLRRTISASSSDQQWRCMDSPQGSGQMRRPGNPGPHTFVAGKPFAAGSGPARSE